MADHTPDYSKFPPEVLNRLRKSAQDSISTAVALLASNDTNALLHSLNPIVAPGDITRAQFVVHPVVAAARKYRDESRPTAEATATLTRYEAPIRTALEATRAAYETNSNDALHLRRKRLEDVLFAVTSFVSSAEQLAHMPPTPDALDRQPDLVDRNGTRVWIEETSDRGPGTGAGTGAAR